MKKTVLILFSILSLGLLTYAQDNDNFMHAQQFFINGEYEKAKKIYERLYQQRDYKNLAFEGYINTLLKLREYDTAEKIIKKDLRENPANPNNKVSLIQLYIEKGDKNNADKYLQDLLQKLPVDNFSISQIANGFYRINQFEYAAKVLNSGRKVLNDQTLFSFELINLYRYLRQKDLLTQEILNIIELQPDYLPTAKSSLSRVYENNQDYQTLKSILLRRIQKNTSSIALSDLLAWTYVELKEYNFALIQAISIDKRLNEDGSAIFMLASVLKNNYEYEYAQKALDYIISKGKTNPFYISSQIELLKLKQLQAEKKGLVKTDLSSLEAAYESVIHEFGQNQRTLFAILELAKLKANQLSKVNAADSLLTNALNIPRLSVGELAQIKLELADINILNNNPWEASLLYGQIEKSLPNTILGQEAKFRNAKLSFYNADFKWAKAQLDVLKASTSQLIANDALDLSLLIQDHFDEDSVNSDLQKYAKAEFFREQHLYERALSSLDSILMRSPLTKLADDILLSKAKIYTSLQQFQEAISAYKKLHEAYPASIWADDALYHLGILYQDKLEDSKTANAYYEKLINEFPGSLYTTDARRRFRRLRGDSL